MTRRTTFFFLVLMFAAAAPFTVRVEIVDGTTASLSGQVSAEAHFVAGVEEPSTTPMETRDPPNCTYTPGYWKTHPEAWPVPDVEIGGVSYAQVFAVALLETEPGVDTTYTVVQQLIASKLNILNGADGNVVQDAIDAADTWLGDNGLGSDPPDPSREEGIQIAEALADYNKGRIGPGRCGEAEDPLP